MEKQTDSMSNQTIMKDNITNTPSMASPTLSPSIPHPTSIPSLLPSSSLYPSYTPSSKPVPTSTIFSRNEGMTLQAIGFTLGGGLCVTVLAVLAFGIAVSRRSTNIAPRCTARHPNTIYRSRRDIYRKNKKKKGGRRGGDRTTSLRQSKQQEMQQLNARANRLTSAVSSESNIQSGSVNSTAQASYISKSTASKSTTSKKAKSTPLKTAKQATLKSTTLATKLVTGLDLASLSAAEQKQRQEEEMQSRQFKKNAIGQPVYVGQGARTKLETKRNSSDGYYDHAVVKKEELKRHSSDSLDAIGLHPTRSNISHTSGNANLQGQLYDMDSGVPVDDFGKELAALNKDALGEVDYDVTNEMGYEESHPQDRGNPFLGWIPWTLHLSYDRMLRGIPGTGTRDGGMGGKLLGVNLDAVVLFRFHDLCLRVTAVATFCCVCVILPLNLSACAPTNDFCVKNANLTNYGRTTIANIIQTTNTTTLQTEDFQFWTAFFWTHSSISHLMRLYGISLCTWFITWYTLTSVKREWRENLVLRRVYYLEADHYGNRQSELDRTIYNPIVDGADSEHDVSEDESDIDIRKRRAINKGGNTVKTSKYKNRDPWIPDPEHRDTIPNIELYSVLVGGLPSLPTEVVNTEDIETAISFSKRASIDWQLAVATTFFDHCVPNQPGFSSSVVAVTILPAAPELAKAWRKWYAAAAALRRLRFIRTVIDEKRHYDIDEVGGDEESPAPSPKATVGEIAASNFHSNNTPARGIPQDRPRVTFLDDDTASGRFQDAETKRQVSQYRQTYGQNDASDLDYRIFRSLNYGPEQQAVYSREMAQGAAACCPHGCCEGRVRRQPIDRLLEMEEATIERLEAAQEQLQQAQMQAAVSIVDKGDNPFKKGKSFDETEMMLQNTTEATIRTSPTRPAASHCSNNESIELPTLEDIFSLSNDDLESLDIQPKQPDVINDSRDQWGCSLSKSKESSTGSQAEWNQSLSKSNDSNTTSHKSLAIETSQSKSIAAPITSKNRTSSNNSNAALQTINEHSTNKNVFMSPQQRNFDILSPANSTLNQSRLAGSFLRMTSEGKFVFNNTCDMDDESISASAHNGATFDMNGADLTSPATVTSLRRRALTGQSSKTNKSDAELTTASNQWEQVKNILKKDDIDTDGNNKSKPEIETGVWSVPTFRETATSMRKSFVQHLKSFGRWTRIISRNNPLTQKIAKDSTYAVVTFSSRQAATAARHCVADGRGVERWLSLETVPVPPLADAAPCDMITCRGCCRPVTLNLNQNQLMLRRYIALASLVFIYIFYTIPITAAQKVVEPANLRTTLPGLFDFFNETAFLSVDLISGMISGLLYTTFFALCPVMFKMIANAGSQATSVQEAEKYALHYYWYFMLTTAFVFTYFADAAIDLWYHSNVEQSLNELANNIANATPLRTSATWLNWIIVRTTMTLPLQYMLQVNTFIFGCIGWKCCARCTLGGGPGGPIPYRIYIDGGVVLVCVIALAPQSPLVAPIALLYYIVCTPLWRRNCIFMYRPKFDSGGERWPFLSDVMITSLYMGQFLLTLQMALRDALGPALFAGLPAIPTYLYRNYLHKRFKRAYEDAGLLQTSLLDGWDNTIPSSAEKREEFRRFLVDAHKAAYIPVCIAGGATNILTAEPAVVINSENDDLIGYSDVASCIKPDSAFNAPDSPYFGDQSLQPPNLQPEITAASLQSNRGAYMRRALSFSTPRSSLTGQNYSEVNGPNITVDGNKRSLFSQKWQRAQEEMESMSVQNEDPGCAQQ